LNPDDEPVLGEAKAGRRSVLEGYLMQITNPKAIVYWLAVVAVAGLSAAPWPIIGLFLIGSMSNSFFGHGAWAIAFSSRPFLSLYARARRWVDAVLGGFFAFVAFKLATSET
ncbi:MAG: LysE family transporter, partial [Paracoccaceae bacterium]